MQNRLIIYIQANHSNAEPLWLAGGVLHHGDADVLYEHARDREVIVLVPAQDVLLTAITLPKMSRARLIQAIPFALEEQVIADVEVLHFAMGGHLADGSVPVAIVAKSKMSEWMALLATWRVKAAALIPVTFALPEADNSWHAMVDTVAIVRTEKQGGFACDAPHFFDYMQLAIAGAAQPPQELILKNYANHTYAGLLSPLVPVKEEFVDSAALLMNLASSLPSKLSLNLLQQDYAVKQTRLPQLKIGWQIAGYLAFAWVFLMFLFPSISSLILGYQIRSLNQDISQIYKRYFPQATSIVAPKQRLQEKLQTLSARGSESQPLLLLGHLGKGVTQFSGIQLKRLEYQNHQMTVEMLAATPETLSTFTNFLTDSGLDVRQQNVDLNDGARVSATLVIRR